MLSRHLPLEDFERVNNALDTLTEVFGAGLHIGENLITFDQAMGFAQDSPFIRAVAAASPTLPERSILWRVHTAVWAARLGLPLKGSFVDVGARQGFEAAVIGRALSLAEQGRDYVLFDGFTTWRFEPFPGGAVSEVDLSPVAIERVAFMPTARVIKTKSLDDLEQAPAAIAFPRIEEPDPSQVTGMIAKLFPRLSEGGCLIIEGYGSLADRKQSVDRYLSHLAQPVLDLPTGQGLIIKR